MGPRQPKQPSPADGASPEMDVDKYLQRIGYSGSREPTLHTLRELCRAHSKAVAYSNFSYFGGPRTVLDLQKIYDAIITRKQGGICYELNGLFFWLLQQLGFEVRRGQGRSYVDGEFSVPYHHMTLVVRLSNGEEWCCDVGWPLYEPVHMTLMKPQVIKGRGIFRIKIVPGEKDWYYFQRHKKSVLDTDEHILKRGPGTLDAETQLCIEENCNAADSDHWSHIFMFCDRHNELEAYSYMNEYHQDVPTCNMHANLIAIIFTEKGLNRIMGTELAVKEQLDPLTEKLELTEITSDQQASQIMKDYFKVLIDFELKYFPEKN